MIATTVYRVSDTGVIDGVLSDVATFEHVEDVRAKHGRAVMVEHRYETSQVVFYDQYWPGKEEPKRLCRNLTDGTTFEVPRA